MVYYAIATYYIKQFRTFPILLLRGNKGTGKSAALEQVSKMLDYVELIGGKREAAVRDKLGDTPVAIIDEGDDVESLEKLLTWRYSRTTGQIEVNRAQIRSRWKLTPIDIFGATIVGKRRPFADAALRSRTIEVVTKKKIGAYQIVERLAPLQKIADDLKVEFRATSERVMNNWEPLLAVARAVGDSDWRKYAEKQIDMARRGQSLDNAVEPTDAVIYALKAISGGNSGRVRLNEVKRTLEEEFDIKLVAGEIMTVCLEKGIKVVKPQGYPQAEVDPEQIERLIKEMEPVEDESGEKGGDIPATI
jgi:hypothetical protein